MEIEGIGSCSINGSDPGFNNRYWVYTHNGGSRDSLMDARVFQHMKTFFTN